MTELDREYWRGVRTTAIVLLCLWLSSFAWAAEIAGPEQVAEHKLATYKLDGATPQAQAIWTVRPLGCSTVQTGLDLILTGKPGAYELEAIVVDFDARTMEKLTHAVTIGDDPNPPPPPPPDELTGLAKTVYDLAAVANDKPTAKALADNYAVTISAINAGAYDSIELAAAKRKIVSELFAANSVLTKSSPPWKALFAKLDEIFAAADKAGELSTLQEISKRFAEIETGLRRAAK